MWKLRFWAYKPTAIFSYGLWTYILETSLMELMKGSLIPYCSFVRGFLKKQMCWPNACKGLLNWSSYSHMMVKPILTYSFLYLYTRPLFHRNCLQLCVPLSSNATKTYSLILIYICKIFKNIMVNKLAKIVVWETEGRLYILW